MQHEMHAGGQAKKTMSMSWGRFAVLLGVNRSQAVIGDVSFMRAMSVYLRLGR